MPADIPILSPLEARVLGVLAEKQRTVPGAYPLTLNSLIAGCNQKSGRDPIMEASKSEAQAALDRLKTYSLIVDTSMGDTSRYAHNLEEKLHIPMQSIVLLALLILRGQQTPGELRINCESLYKFADISAVESFLSGLETRAEGGLVVELPRQPGSHENRWMHLLSGPPATGGYVPGRAISAATAGDAMAPEIAALKAKVATLEAEICELREMVGKLCAKLGISAS